MQEEGGPETRVSSPAGIAAAATSGCIASSISAARPRRHAGPGDAHRVRPESLARIALIVYPDGVKRYIIAPEGLKAGMTVNTGPAAEPKVGNCLPLAKIPTGWRSTTSRCSPAAVPSFAARRASVPP